MLSFSQQTLFIADLHLKPSEPQTLSLACKFFTAASQAKALYILGDLFEYWLGDDAADPGLQLIHDALLKLSESGCKLHLMHGNRDFLLGHTYAESIKATLHISDTLTIKLGSQEYLLLHGDTLCTDDVGYQQLRQYVRNPDWQAQFLAKTVEERMGEANNLREKSRQAVADKQAVIMDVNEEAVVRCFNEHKINTLIHGHTHRPNEHQYNAASPRTRLVLGDWHNDHAVFALHDGQTLKLDTFKS